MLTLHISWTYDQFQNLLACAFIVAHIAQHHLEHFYTLTDILLKLLHSLHFLLSFSFMHFLRGGGSPVNEEFLSLLLFGLDEPNCHKGSDFEIFEHSFQGGEILTFFRLS
jgi:hypothetical protein